MIGKGTYELDPDFCAQKYLSISNHGFNGPKKIAVLIEDMEGFEIDFSGSTLLCHGIMTPIAIVNSRNITLRNLRLKNTALQMMQASVVAHGDGWIDTEPLEDGSLWQIRAGGLYGLCPGVTLAHSVLNIEYNGQTGEIEPGTADNTLDVPADALTFEQLNNGCVRIYGGKRKPPIGNVLVFASSRRLG